MKVSLSFVTAAFFLASGVFSLPARGRNDEVTVMSESMKRMRDYKEKLRNTERKAGFFEKNRYANVAKVTPCKNGKSGAYSCSNVDMYGFLSHQAMGSTTREGNDVWGWTSDDGREFVVAGQTDGAAFVELLKDGTLKYLGHLPTATGVSIWRDMKVINGYFYIGADAIGHGLQVFDMRKLLNMTTPRTFSKTTDLTAYYTGFGNSHNIVANEATNMIYAVGSDKCSGGLYMLNVKNPSKPKFMGCAGEDGYIHDAQCLIYNGPDNTYKGREICFGYNEDTLTIYDVHDKSKVKIVSRTPYTGSSYTHQGWIANAAQTHLLMDDELDEQDNNLENTTTYIWDITKLSAPVNTGAYKSPVMAVDHNLYVKDNIAYLANYRSGLRIVDINTISSDPDGSKFKEIGFFDVYPENDKTPDNEMGGAWSVYPYFKSGFLVVNSIERGLFSLKFTGARK